MLNLPWDKPGKHVQAKVRLEKGISNYGPQHDATSSQGLRTAAGICTKLAHIQGAQYTELFLQAVC